MDLDWLVFPSPDSSYTTDRCSGELLFIPKIEYGVEEEKIKEDSDQIKPKHIPCIYLRSTSNSLCPKYALFFHGNAEDINLASEILNHIRFTLSINVIAPEYPGYGVYPGRPSEEQIFADTLSIYHYLVDTLKIHSNNIIVFGRSLGTSPSTYLASKREVSALILISPMMSIQYVVRDILGKLVSYTIKDRFENYKMIEEVTCPILIIHGQNDTLIKYYHATELYNRAKAPCELILPENMDHNEFDFFQEFSEPLLDFISRNAIFAYTQPSSNKVSPEMTKVPLEFTGPLKQWNCLTKLLKKFSIN